MERGQFSRTGGFFLSWVAAACAILFACSTYPSSAAALARAPQIPPDLSATHTSITLIDNTTTPQTISGADLTSLDDQWTIKILRPWGDVVDDAQGTYALFRGTMNTGIDGTPVAGSNYALVKNSITDNAVLSLPFSLPLFGDPTTPSGTYTLIVAEEPTTKDTFDSDGNYTGTVPYTDQDFINWLASAGSDNDDGPLQYRFIQFNYVAGAAVTGCISNCHSNVLFIPGVEASRLYDTDGGETKLWEPGSDADAQKLAINPDGTSVRSDIYTRDIIDNAYIINKGDVYKSFTADMNSLVTNGAINEWKSAPYDWRLSLDQILSSGSQTGTHISYLNATDTPYIIQELKSLAASSQTGKVTIVAHSNGGLVAKALMQKLGGAQTQALIDKVILVDVPQVGTPVAVAGLLHGYGLALPTEQFPNAIDDGTARQVGDTMPGLYDLLPSASYFTYVDDPVITFSTSTVADWATKYGPTIHSQGNLETFLSDTQRTSPAITDLNNPTILSDSFIAQAQAAHQSLDAWTPPAGVQIIQIAGWGVPTTVSGINYVRTLDQGNLTILPDPQFTIDGDGTVVVPSALWMSTTTGVTNYWVDLKDYNKSNFVNTVGGIFPYSHVNILEVNPVRSFIEDSITGNTQTLSSYPYLSAAAPAFTGSRLRYALHSPLTLNLYDNQGNHTGVSTTTGEIDEQIPGTYYTNFAGVQYIFTDASTSAHIAMNGYANGTFTFNVDELQGDAVVASTTFQNIPTTPNTSVSMDVGSDINTLSPLTVDENGDGKDDFTLVPKLDGIVTLDTTAPTTSVSLSGTLGSNSWYTSSVLVTFSATDTGSGVSATYFSLDDAATSTGTTTSVTSEGIHTLIYYSIDNSGNTESPHTLTIKIDKTPPEASLTFSTSTQALLITGIDNLSTTSVVTTATSSLITDQAGHTLLISFTQPKNPKARRINVTIAGLKYDNVATSTSVILKYKWNTDASTTAYTMFAAYLQNATSSIEAHYRPKKLWTILMLPPQDIDDSDDDSASDSRPIKTKLPGMVIPFEMTNKGVINLGY